MIIVARPRDVAVSTVAQSSAPQAVAAPALRPARQRVEGWFGLGFAVLALASQTYVSVPRATATTAAISLYYHDNRTLVTVTQAVELIAMLFFFVFAMALARRADVAAANWVRVAGLAVLTMSLLANVPILALAQLSRVSPGWIRSMVTWTDRADIGLFVAVCYLGVACLLALAPPVLRLGSAVLCALALGHAILMVLHVYVLAVVAPLGFAGFVLLTALWILREREPVEPS